MHSLPRYRPNEWWCADNVRRQVDSTVTHSDMVYRNIWCDLCGTIAHDGVWLLRQLILNYCRDCIGSTAQRTADVKALETWVEQGVFKDDEARQELLGALTGALVRRRT